jgi:hypothetical protein
MVTDGVVVVGAGGETKIGEGGMVPGRGERGEVTLLEAGDRGMVATWFAFNGAGIVEPTTRPVDTGTTAFDANPASRP